MLTAIRAKRLWTGNALIEEPLVLVEEGRIRAIRNGAALTLDRPHELFELPEALLAPAFFDVHTHGAAGHDLMEATPEAVRAVSQFVAAHGVGAFLATTVTAPVETLLRTLGGLASQITPESALRGIHLEGPFLAPAKNGAHPPEHLREADCALFDRFFDAAGGKIALMTLAPELPGAIELIAHATARGVRVSLGHSAATAEQSRAAITAGATSATHTFNAMCPIEAREPGILGAALTEDALYAELICDGVHTAPEAVKLWWKCKGSERAILITDAISATGMTDGRYRLGEYEVEVAQGRATTHGVLAGSTLTLDRALTNFLRFTGAGLEEALPLVTANPARMTGLEGSIGTLAEGLPAHLVALGENGELLQSFRHGKPVIAPEIQ